MKTLHRSAGCPVPALAEISGAAPGQGAPSVRPSRVAEAAIISGIDFELEPLPAVGRVGLEPTADGL